MNSRWRATHLIACLAAAACSPTTPQGVSTPGPQPATVAGQRPSQVAPGPVQQGGLPHQPPPPAAAPPAGQPAAPAIPPGMAAFTDGPSGDGGTDHPLPPPVIVGLATLPQAILSASGSGVISNNGAGVVSNNGAGLISHDGAGFISDNGAGIISNNGAGVISNNGGAITGGGHFSLLGLSAPQAPVRNVFLYLTNRDEKFYYSHQTGQIFTTATDATGNYSFGATEPDAFPYGKDVIVNLLIAPQFRLTGFLSPYLGRNVLDVNLGSTLATELLRADAARKGLTLTAYNGDLFARLAHQTESAVESGDIAALTPDRSATGTAPPAGTFDLDIAGVDTLRSQYVTAISAVDAANVAVKAISDGWNALLGYRPVALSTLLGNGADAQSLPDGHMKDDGPVTDPRGVTLGTPSGLALARRGDLFVGVLGKSPVPPCIRWLRPDGTLHTIPWYQNGLPQGMRVEQEPTDDPRHPGTLLVVDQAMNAVLRVPILDVDQLAALGQNAPLPKEVAGDPFFDQDDPYIVDGPAVVPPIDPSHPNTSNWRLADEGPRRYVVGDLASGAGLPPEALHAAGDPVPNPARFALLNQPTDVEEDELGNIYIADYNNDRIRMIAGAGAEGKNLFGYCTPIDDNGDGVVDHFGAPAVLHAGCMYTIAGNPSWDPTRAQQVNGYWFGDFLEGPGMTAQQAHLDRPSSFALEDGYLYFSDSDNQRIRRIERATGLIETVAGSPPGPQQVVQGDAHYPPGTAGDDGPAKLAQFAFPHDLRFDHQGRLYIADASAGRIRRIDTDGTIHAVAGKLQPLDQVRGAFKGDAEARFQSEIYYAWHIILDAHDNVILSDQDINRVRKVWCQWE